jgi:hypothetical protein
MWGQALNTNFTYQNIKMAMSACVWKHLVFLALAEIMQLLPLQLFSISVWTGIVGDW